MTGSNTTKKATRRNIPRLAVDVCKSTVSKLKEGVPGQKRKGRGVSATKRAQADTAKESTKVKEGMALSDEGPKTTTSAEHKGKIEELADVVMMEDWTTKELSDNEKQAEETRKQNLCEMFAKALTQSFNVTQADIIAATNSTSIQETFPHFKKQKPDGRSQLASIPASTVPMDATQLVERTPAGSYEDSDSDSETESLQGLQQLAAVNARANAMSAVAGPSTSLLAQSRLPSGIHFGVGPLRVEGERRARMTDEDLFG